MNANQTNGIFYGWYVVLACSVIYGLSGVAHYSAPIFFPFISKEMGWASAELGTIYTIYLGIFLCGGLLAGFLVDRIGGRRTFIIGSFIAGTGLVLMTTMQSINQMIIYFSAISAIGIAMQLVIPTQAVARKWFVKRAGLTAGIIAACFGLISSFLAPTFTYLAGTYGWRTVLLQYTISFEVIIILLAIFVVRDTPESMGLHPDGVSPNVSANSQSAAEETEEPYFTVFQALKTPQLWLIAFAFGFCSLVIISYLAHLQMWAVNVGASAEASGTFFPFWALPSVVARIAGGWLGDRLGKRPVAIGALILMVGVSIAGWLGIHSPTTLYVFSIGGGFLMIIPVVLGTPFLGDLFGRRHLGTLVGCLGIMGGTFAALGPFFWGKIATLTGSYNQGLLYAAIGYAIGAICIACIRPTSVERETVIAARQKAAAAS
ncbi:nitrate/nitrite transporter [Thermodesulfobacteriota bacterium]